MKRYIKSSSVIICAALVLASCSKTEDVQGNPDSALQIESVSGISPFALMHEPVSKAVITGNTLTGSDAATGVGIFVTESDGSAYDGHANGYTNVKFANSGSGWSTATPVYLSDTEGKLYGYFPYNSSATDLKAIPVESSLNGTDYLYADSKTVSHTNKSVSLQMNHALSRLHLTIKKGANFTANAPLSKITLKSTAIDATGTMDLATGAVTASKKSNETGTVELTTDGEITADGIEKDILLVPANNSEGKKSISISLMIAGNPAGITIPAENGLDIRSGIQNNVTLTVEDTGVKVSGVGVGEWGGGFAQQVQVGAHTVTVKLAETDKGIADDIFTNIKVDGDKVIIRALSHIGNHLKCTLAGGEFCPQSRTADMIYTFTLPDIASDITATIGYAKQFNINFSASNNIDWGTSTYTGGERYEGEKFCFTAIIKGSACQFEWQDAKGRTLSTNNPYEVFPTSDITVKAVFTVPDRVFSVSNDGGTTTKQIYFSKGNLYYDGANWDFEKNQYDFRTYSGLGSCINGTYSQQSGTPDGNWGLFGWVGSSSKFNDAPEKYGVSVSQTENEYGRSKGEPLKSDWGNTIDNEGTWRTLTAAEWIFMAYNRINASEKWGYATVNGVPGIIFLPDVFADPKTNNGSEAFVPNTIVWSSNAYTAGDNWGAMEKAGAVFLPAAGLRDGRGMTSVPGVRGLYWTSSASTLIDLNALYLEVASQYFHPGDYPQGKQKCFGCAVRLVTEVKQ